ncbi:MAG: GNAT family N-acetyltransferase [Actinomycetota bacterium]|nr:GNAT family N-acetyltransferase [Actinomycetota bacterium]
MTTDSAPGSPSAPSTLRAGYRLVDVPFERREDITSVNTWAFPSSTTPEQREKLVWPLNFSRTRGVETDDGELVAFHASYEFADHPVPGARIPISGLTWVGVHPSHRRRGLLRAMIDDHFARSLARGEAVSALWAAEMAIYGRFGYGLAAQSVSLKIPRGASLRAVPGADDVRVRLEEMSSEKHATLMRDLMASVDRPGWTHRSTPELEAGGLQDPEFWRDGFESMRVAVAERDGEVVGFARFRRKLDWNAEGPAGRVEVRQYVAKDPAVTRALWGVLLDLDLMATIEVGTLPVDDPLMALLVNWPAAQPRLAENLWTRLLDVPVALASRRYAAPVDVILEVTDALLPANAGRWRLEGGLEGATVTRTDDAAHLALDVRELGSLFLGGIPLAQLVGAGLVTELEPGAAFRASAAFGWPVSPTASFVW